MPDEEIEPPGPACARSEHTVSETLGEDPTRAGEILATEPSNDDVEDDGAAADGKIGGTASISAMDMAGRGSAERATRSMGSTAKGESDPIRIRGHAIHDEAGRHRITSMKSLIHNADSFSNQRRSEQRTSSKVSQTQDCSPIDR